MSSAPEPHIPPSVARARFARWVKRQLDAARDRGLNDKQIQQATGVSPSTFHRWQAGQGKELPELDRVKKFARGLGASVDEAVKALGVSDTRATREPEPPLPPEVRIILRALADPNVSDGNRLVIREMLLMLAERAAAASRPPKKGSTEEEAG